MEREAWWSAIFIRPFRDRVMWAWAVIPLICAGIATCVGVMLTSNIHSLTITGPMKLMVYLSPATANGLTFSSGGGRETIGLGIGVVLVYLALAFGLGLVGWLSADRRNVAGVLIPSGIYITIQLWIMAMMTGQSVSLVTEPTTIDDPFEMLGAGLLGLAEVASDHPPMLHWGTTFLMAWFMLGLTSLAALAFLTWWQEKSGVMLDSNTLLPATSQVSAHSMSGGQMSLTGLRVPDASHVKDSFPTFMHANNGSEISYGSSPQPVSSATRLGALHAEALNVVGVALQRPSSPQQQPSLVEAGALVPTTASPATYCPRCGNEMKVLGDGRRMCQDRQIRRKRFPGCGTILENLSESDKLCESCQHPLRVGDEFVTRHCHNCGSYQAEGCGGP